MNTHTVIFKCNGAAVPEISRFASYMDALFKNPQMEYFGRNGRRLYSNQKALMESLKGKFFIQFSFRHLLQLDSDHAIAVIKAALKMGMVRLIRKEGDGIEVVLR